MNWILVTIITCSFGFFKDLRPSEAYLTPYLTGPMKNLTVEQVDNEIYPWWTYSFLLWLVPVFLLTDYFRYKPIIIIDGLAYIITWALLLWAQGVPSMKVMQVVYGLATAGEIAYYSYLFCIVSHNYYQKIASFTRSISLFARFIAYLIGQLVISFGAMDYFDLNIFSFVSVCIAFVITVIIPRPEHSNIFHRFPNDSDVSRTEKGLDSHSSIQYDNNDSQDSHVGTGNCRLVINEEAFEQVDFAATENEQNETGHIQTETNEKRIERVDFTDTENVIGWKHRYLSGLKFMWTEIREIYSSKAVIIWSVWWALASCGNFQVGNYIQNLWKVISPQQESRKIYNGAVDAAATLLGSILVFFVGFLPINWSIRGRAEILMAIVCGGNAALLIVMGNTTKIWIAYVFYVIFRVSYQTVITIATPLRSNYCCSNVLIVWSVIVFYVSVYFVYPAWQTSSRAQIAEGLSKQRYGLVFGCNMFLALLLETILTAIVVDEAGLGVDVRTQFNIYGGYFVVISFIFLAAAIFYCLRTRTRRPEYVNPVAKPISG